MITQKQQSARKRVAELVAAINNAVESGHWGNVVDAICQAWFAYDDETIDHVVYAAAVEAYKAAVGEENMVTLMERATDSPCKGRCSGREEVSSHDRGRFLELIAIIIRQEKPVRPTNAAVVNGLMKAGQNRWNDAAQEMLYAANTGTIDYEMFGAAVRAFDLVRSHVSHADPEFGQSSKIGDSSLAEFIDAADCRKAAYDESRFAEYNPKISVSVVKSIAEAIQRKLG